VIVLYGFQSHYPGIYLQYCPVRPQVADRRVDFELIIQKTWSIVDAIFRNHQAPFKLKTSCVDFTKQ
jgi:hypothetical protein